MALFDTSDFDRRTRIVTVLGMADKDDYGIATGLRMNETLGGVEPR